MRSNVSELIRSLNLDLRIVSSDVLCQKCMSEIIAFEVEGKNASVIDWEYISQSAIEADIFYRESLGMMKTSVDRDLLSCKIKVFILHHLIVRSNDAEYARCMQLRDASPFYHYAMH